MSDHTILLVDDDAVLSQVLRRVLGRQGYQVLEAASVGEALRLAREQHPDLGLVDLCLPDGDGVELARGLEQEGQRLPLILMTAYPLRLRDQPELAEGFAEVLTKPLNLEELRQTVDRVLAGAAAAPVPASASAAVGAGTGPRPPAPPGLPLQPAAPPEVPPAPQPAVTGRPRRLIAWGTVAALAVAAVVLLALWQPAGMASLKDLFHRSATPADKSPDLATAHLIDPRHDPEAMELPPDVGARLGVKAVKVRDMPPMPRRLVLAGSLSFDPTRLFRVQSRFGGEVIQLGTTEDREAGRTVTRQLRPGDAVRKGQLLAVVLSKDLGEKKSELVDALVRLAVDEDLLTKLQGLFQQGNTPEATYLQQRSQVAADRNAAARAELTLRTWQLPEEEIEAVKAEARRVGQLHGRRDIAKETEWAKVEVKAPSDGVIVEMNVNVRNIVDTTFDLYKVANLRKLGVLLNAYEEDLRLLTELPENYPWEIRLSANPERPPLKNDGVERVGYIVDPNQHTTPVLGLVYNQLPNGQPGDLRVGQFITATVDLEPPRQVVALPTSALDEDGQESVIFVQPDRSRPVYRLRRVAVTQRAGNAVYVRKTPTAEEKKRGLQGVGLDDLVVTQGVVQLKATLEDLQAQQRQKELTAPRGR
jgi:cobalt-zinc-cadmium efflux system membrane fusion protein